MSFEEKLVYTDLKKSEETTLITVKSQMRCKMLHLFCDWHDFLVDVGFLGASVPGFTAKYVE